MTNSIDMKPEVRKGLECIGRNRPYLVAEGVLGGKRKVTNLVDDFYDLGEYQEVVPLPTRGPIRYYRFGSIAFDEAKVGSLPPADLISFLDEIRDEPISSSKESLRYENVRESFRDPDSPKYTNLRRAGSVLGVIVCTGGFFPAVAFTSHYDSGVLPALGIIAASVVGGLVLTFKTMIDQQKAWQPVRQLHSENTRGGHDAYWELKVRADEADVSIHHYRKLFQENKGKENE